MRYATGAKMLGCTVVGATLLLGGAGALGGLDMAMAQSSLLPVETMQRTIRRSGDQSDGRHQAEHDHYRDQRLYAAAGKQGRHVRAHRRPGGENRDDDPRLPACGERRYHARGHQQRTHGLHGQKQRRAGNLRQQLAGQLHHQAQEPAYQKRSQKLHCYLLTAKGRTRRPQPQPPTTPARTERCRDPWPPRGAARLLSRRPDTVRQRQKPGR